MEKINVDDEMPSGCGISDDVVLIDCVTVDESCSVLVLDGFKSYIRFTNPILELLFTQSI